MKNILSILLLFLSISSSAQQSKIDSLTIEFNKAKQDTVKAEILAKIGVEAYYKDFIIAKFYNDSLIRFSKGKSKKYEALGYRMQGTLLLIDGNYKDSEKAYLKSLSYFEETQDNAYRGALVGNLATLYARQNDIDKADSLYLEAIELVKDVEGDVQIVNFYINLGINASNANKLELATTYFTKTLKEAEKKDNMNYQLYAYNNLSSVYLKRNLLDEAEHNLANALAVGKEIEDLSGLMYTYNLYGILYDELSMHKKALENFLLSLDYAMKVNDIEQIHKTKINIGRQYKYLSNFKNAETNFIEAIKISKQLQDSTYVVTGNLNLAILNLKQANILRAENNLKEAELFMPKIPDSDYHVLYKEISENYRKLNLNEQAYTFLEKYVNTSDSLYLKNDVKKIADITKKYELEKKEKELALTKAKILEDEVQLSNKQQIIYISLALCFGLLSLLVIILYRNLKKKIAQEQLKEAFNQGLEKYLISTYDLKDNEIQLWLKIVEGHTEKELADYFYRSIDTIKNWRKSLYSKLKQNGETFKQKNAIELYYKVKDLYVKEKN